MENEVKSTKDTPGGLEVFLFYSPKCKACEAIKPKFEEIPAKFQKTSFYKIELNDQTFQEYKQLVPPGDPVLVEAKDEDGSVILKANGQPLMDYQYDENGEIVRSVPISVPHFFVFNDKELLGDIVANIEQLEQVLEQLEAAHE